MTTATYTRPKRDLIEHFHADDGTTDYRRVCHTHLRASRPYVLAQSALEWRCAACEAEWTADEDQQAYRRYAGHTL